MKCKSFIFLGILGVFHAHLSLAQFELSGEIRPRAQFRNGFQTLPSDTDKPGFFISQRTRLNMAYQHEKQFSTYISLQDVRVWGDQDQLSDEPSIGIYQAWANIRLLNHLHLKAGRQELLYDDGYILGNLNWRDTGRSHDAALLQWQDSSFQAHLGLAYNQDKSKNFNTYYSGNYYKTLQVLWLKKEWQALSASFLGVSRGMQMADSTLRYMQTFGPAIKYKKGRYAFDGILYYQTGKDMAGKKVQAWFWSAKVRLVSSPKWSWLVGADVLSGTSWQDLADPGYSRNHTFDILYGLRHGHFGSMDYFYLNFTPTAGLQDLMFKTKFQPDKKFHLNLDVHSFSSQASLLDTDRPGEKISQHLGIETDLYFTHTPYEAVTFAGGYSQMFASAQMEMVKGGGNSKQLANWIWLGVTLKPKFLSTN